MQTLVGCDFSSAPTKRKQIVLAWGLLEQGRVRVTALQRLSTLDAFSAWLQESASWVGGFDLPFGLPRELVETLGWPTAWEACIRHYAALERSEIRARFATFCAERPVGGKFAHRATDKPAGSSPSMKWVNPPVAYMLHAGVVRMLDAGVYFPGLQLRSEQPELRAKVALEAYPGLLAREILDHRSYKSDDSLKQTPERLIARKDLVTALEMGKTHLQWRLKLTHAQRDTLVEDASGDALDAVLCLVQAAWGWQRHVNGDALFGLHVDLDPLEGWILSA